MATSTLEWNWRTQTIRLGTDASGTGPKVLLLPALSSISSRREIRPLQERLVPRYSTMAQPNAIMATGHVATYLLKHAASASPLGALHM